MIVTILRYGATIILQFIVSYLLTFFGVYVLAGMILNAIYADLADDPFIVTFLGLPFELVLMTLTFSLGVWFVGWLFNPAREHLGRQGPWLHFFVTWVTSFVGLLLQQILFPDMIGLSVPLFPFVGAWLGYYGWLIYRTIR